MDEEEGGGIRLSKRFSDEGGEVDYKTKAGTAWSHSYLNQKPWHPLSYPNQRRKWIAEQTHSQKQRRSEEISREYAQEQEFFRQTALVSKKEKEKMEMMKAVSFMYVRPPGYNAESAKAAEIVDEQRKQEQTEGPSSAMEAEAMANKGRIGGGKKKSRPKDVFGRALPTEEQFEVLKNAPRLETGVPARSKPFGVEIRNVKCVRCGNFGHQSGDRECPLKDVIMPNEESRLKRDDPLTAILAQTDTSEPLKWELKQKPGMSPPRGGFRPDDPNQQIVAEDVFDEYGGFLDGESIPELLTNFSSKPRKKKSGSKRKHRRRSSPDGSKSKDKVDESTSDYDERRRSKKRKPEKKKRKHNNTSSSDNSESEEHARRRRSRRHNVSGLSDDNSNRDGQYRRRRNRRHNVSGSSYNSDNDERDRRRSSRRYNVSDSSENSDSDRRDRGRSKRHSKLSSSINSKNTGYNKRRSRHSYSSSSDTDGHHRSRDHRH